MAHHKAVIKNLFFLPSIPLIILLTIVNECLLYIMNDHYLWNWKINQALRSNIGRGRYVQTYITNSTRKRENYWIFFLNPTLCVIICCYCCWCLFIFPFISQLLQLMDIKNVCEIILTYFFVFSYFSCLLLLFFLHTMNRALMQSILDVVFLLCVSVCECLWCCVIGALFWVQFENFIDRIIINFKKFVEVFNRLRRKNYFI